MIIFRMLLNKVRKLNNIFLFLMTFFFVVGSSYVIRLLEPETFPSFFDAFWWVMTTMTTVGYGDFYPVSVAGRTFAIFIYVVGIGILGVVISKIVDFLGYYRRSKGEGKLHYKGKNHIVIVGWSKKSEYALKEILTTKDCGVVIIDELSNEPFKHDRVHYISGSATTKTTIDMANIKEAHSVIIFADDKIENPLLVDGKTMILAASIEQYAPNVKTIIEVIREEHLRSFEHIKVDEFILSNEIISKMAVKSL